MKHRVIELRTYTEQNMYVIQCQYRGHRQNLWALRPCWSEYGPILTMPSFKLLASSKPKDFWIYTAAWCNEPGPLLWCWQIKLAVGKTFIPYYLLKYQKYSIFFVWGKCKFGLQRSRTTGIIVEIGSFLLFHSKLRDTMIPRSKKKLYMEAESYPQSLSLCAIRKHSAEAPFGHHCMPSPET